MPLEVVLYWAIFTYTGYWVSNLIFYWFGVSQPVNPDKLWRLLAFILVDGYVVTAIDFFMDPILVDEGRWAWLTGGPYFGVPWGNFVGWFVVTVMISSIFRTYEYFKINLSWPKKEPLLGLPLIGYFQLIFAMAILSLAKDMRDLTVVGVSLMLPPAIFGALGLKKYWLKK